MGPTLTAIGGTVAALALALVLGGCGAGSDEDVVASFRDDDAARAYVLDGTVPDGVEMPDGVPEDRPGRIGWILTRPDADGDALRLGVRDALAEDPDVLADLVLGVSAVDEPLEEGGAETVFSALGDQPLAVLAAVGGPPADGVALDGDAVVETLAAAGVVPDEDGAALTQPLRELVVDGLLADLQPAGDLPEDEWAAAVAAADAAWAAPAARVWGSIARDACSDEPDGERCTTLVARLTDELDGAVDQVVYETAPVAVLPQPLTSAGDRQPLDDTTRGAWDAVLDGVGLDVAAQVRAAAGL